MCVQENISAGTGSLRFFPELCHGVSEIIDGTFFALWIHRGHTVSLGETKPCLTLSNK
jgi:hypothetical protein